MRRTVSGAELRPYDDRSGYRETVRAIWQRDDEKDIVKHVEIEQGEAKIVLMFDDWFALRDAVDAAIQTVTGQDLGMK